MLDAEQRGGRGDALGLGVLRRYPLVSYFVLACGLSWADELAFHLLAPDVPAQFVVVLATLGPTLAALAVTAPLEGRDGVTRLLHRVILWRVGARWYLFVLFGVPAVAFLGLLPVPGALGSFRATPLVHWLVEYIVVFVVGGIAGGPLFEEPGWRGFALPRIQAQQGPLRGTLILGTIWGCWHLPQYLLVPGWAEQDGGARLSSALVFVLMVIAIAMVMTWVFNHTRGSLLLAMLLHTSVNTAQLLVVNELFPREADTLVNALIGFGALSVVLVAATRGRLGLQTVTPDAARPSA